MIPLANGILDIAAAADETSDPDEALFDYDGVEIVFRDAPQMNNPAIVHEQLLRLLNIKSLYKTLSPTWTFSNDGLQDKTFPDSTTISTTKSLFYRHGSVHIQYWL